MRGCGGSVFPNPDTPRSGQTTAQTQDTIDLLDHLGIDKVVVPGHDWGARAGYLLTTLWPERVERLIALASGHRPQKMLVGTSLPGRYRAVCELRHTAPARAYAPAGAHGPQRDRCRNGLAQAASSDSGSGEPQHRSVFAFTQIEGRLRSCHLIAHHYVGFKSNKILT